GVTAAARLRRASVVAVTLEHARLIRQPPFQAAVRHDAEIAAGRDRPADERSIDEIEVVAALERVVAERHLELPGPQLEGAIEPDVGEGVALGLSGVAELARHLEFDPLEQRALDLQAARLPAGIGP